MATVWVDPLNGNDADDGSTFALGKATLAGAVAVANQGDTINVANTAALVIATTQGADLASDFQGTSYDVNPGLIIQGTDSSGAAAMTELRFADNATTQTLFNLDVTGAPDPAFITVQGFKVNWAANATAATSKIFCAREGVTAGPIRIRYNWFNYSQFVIGPIFNDSTAAVADGTDAADIEFNYINEAGGSGGLAFLAECHQRGRLYFHHNVIYVNGAYSHGRSVFNGQSNDGDQTDHRVYNNTYVIVDDVSASPLWNSADVAPVTSAVKHLHSNVVITLQNTATFNHAQGSATGDSTLYTRVMGFTLFFVPNSPVFPAYGYYQRPWDPDDSDSPEGTDTWATDQVETVTNPTHAFNTPFLWDFEGSAYSVTIAGDYRIDATGTHRTMAQDGGVPGALAENPVVPDISGSNIVISAGVNEAVTESVNIINVGTGTLTITNIVLAGDATLTYAGGTTASIAAGASQAFNVTFTPTVHPTAAVATLTFTSDDPDEGTFVITITGNSVHYWVPGGNLPSTPIGPTSPAYFLNPNVAPGSRGSGVSAEIELKRNTVFIARLATTVGANSDTTSGIVQGTVHLVTNSGLVAIPGLNVTGLRKVLIRPEGGNVTLQLGLSTFLVRDGGCVLVANVSSHHTVLLNNASTIKDVSVHFFGAD